MRWIIEFGWLRHFSQLARTGASDPFSKTDRYQRQNLSQIHCDAKCFDACVVDPKRRHIRKVLCKLCNVIANRVIWIQFSWHDKRLDLTVDANQDGCQHEDQKIVNDEENIELGEDFAIKSRLRLITLLLRDEAEEVRENEEEYCHDNWSEPGLDDTD